MTKENRTPAATPPTPTAEPRKARGRPCVFFDRDGIVNRSPGAGYVERVEDFHLLPEFVEALRLVRDRGYEAVIVTNQRGVSRGLMTQAALDAIHDRLRDALDREGLGLLAIHVCTANDNADPRRKPNPGMLLEAMAAHDLDAEASWMIGDSESDIEAGRRAGCGHTVLVATPSTPSAADAVVSDMAALVRYLAKVLPLNRGEEKR
jgi:histidinol-phosphate phosphatase family protein